MLAERDRLAETAAVLTYRIAQKESGNGTELMTVTAFLLIFAETHRLAETAAVLTYRIAQRETGNGTELMTITAFLLMLAETHRLAETQVGRNCCRVDIQNRPEGNRKWHRVDDHNRFPSNVCRDTQVGRDTGWPKLLPCWHTESPLRKLDIVMSSTIKSDRACKLIGWIQIVLLYDTLALNKEIQLRIHSRV